MAGIVLSFLALTLILIASAWINGQEDPVVPQLPLTTPGSSTLGLFPSRDSSFSLRHVFHRGTKLYPDLHRRLDVQKEEPQGEHRDCDCSITTGPFNICGASHKIHRLANRKVKDVKLMLATQNRGRFAFLDPTTWSTDEVLGPDITDKGTILNLASMTANAYEANRNDSEWVDVGQGFNSSAGFGWENDGLRGHVFSDQTNSTIIIAVKGTTFAVFDDADTTTNDKENDNLFGSCCCGEGGQYLWRQVCHCKTSTYTCNETCLTMSLRKPNCYYQASLDLYGNITELYPASDIILVGHSLGGVVVSLLGLTFGIPTVTFEAYGQALAASRLGLLHPPDTDLSIEQARMYTGGYHFGHTAGKTTYIH